MLSFDAVMQLFWFSGARQKRVFSFFSFLFFFRLMVPPLAYNPSSFGRFKCIERDFSWEIMRICWTGADFTKPFSLFGIHNRCVCRWTCRHTADRLASGRARIWPLARISLWLFPMYHTYVHKYEVTLAWDVTASFFGFKTTSTSLSIYWTLPDTIAWDKSKTAFWPCLFND